MTDKIALITGASRGLGAALAEALAPTHHIVAVARTTGALEEVDDCIQAVGGSATLAPMDITNADAMTHMCGSLQQRWGHVDLWVHAAVHAAPLSPAGHLGRKDWDKSIAVNVTAPGVLIGLVEPLLLEAPAGTALFLDDPRAGEKFFGAYGATKAAQIALARSWQAETVKIGPRVVIETPDPMPTATRARFFPGENRDVLAKPADVAQALVARL